MAFDQVFEVVGCGGEEVEGGGEVVWGVVVDSFDTEAFADDLLGGELDGAAGEDCAGEDEDATGAEVLDALLHRVGVAGEVEDDLGGVWWGVECGSEVRGEGLAVRIGVDSEDFFGAEVVGHGAGI